ncbi:MAG: hypothetical protein IKD76_08525 [Clostridia bacterium]|nr:hypothetical protein [Clostridia bacterium]
MYEVLDTNEDMPIVSLDKVYLDEEKDINTDVYFLDCTRVNGSNKLVP